MRKLLSLVGISLGIAWSASALAPIPAGAETFSYSQTVAQEAVFIPTDHNAAPNETGEIVLKAGNGFPVFARNDTIGIAFDIEWDAEKTEFLGAILQGTVFPVTEFDLAVTHLPSRNTARIVIWTANLDGVAIDPDDVLAKIIFRVRDNARLGDQIDMVLRDVEVAYDAVNPRSEVLQSVQSGVLTIGNPDQPDGFGDMEGDFYFENDILAAPGEERLIALRAADYHQLAGFMFDMSFPGSNLTYLGYETAGTILEGEGFRIIEETTIPNHLGILAATGTAQGVLVEPSTPVLFLRFAVTEDIALGSSIPLEIERMDMVDGNSLALIESEVTSGSITISETSELRITEVTPLSSTSLRIDFSDTIVAVRLNDLRFEPNLINQNSTLAIDGKSVTLRNLTTMEPGTRYRLTGTEAITGNVTGRLSPLHNHAFFHGFPAERPSNNFRIVSTEALSNTTARITMSEAINPATLEFDDITIAGLDVTAASIDETDPKILRITTSDQASLSGSTWLSITNTSTIHDLRSVNDELLSLNVFPFKPFGATSNAPRILSATAAKDDMVHIVFDKALLGSSITTDAFRITESGSSTNLVTNGTFFDLSPDHRTVTLHVVKTRVGKTYRLQIAPGSLRANDTDGLAIDLFGNLATFSGQGTFYTPWDFRMESAEAISSDQVRVAFSEAVAADTVPLTAFEIWSHDSAEIPRKLTITEVMVDGATVILKTAAQQASAAYFVLGDPDVIRSETGETLGVPSSRGFVGFSPDVMRVVSVSPREVDKGEATEVTIRGANFEENVTVRIGSQWLTPSKNTGDTLTVTLPDDLIVDRYDVIVATPAGWESRLPNGIVVVDPEIETRMRPLVLSDESYASPFKVPNDGSTKTTLWVRIQDARGLSDIDKVTADLRKLNGDASANFELHEFVDNKAWYKLEITVPPTVSTSKTPTTVPVTVQNKTGYQAYGTVELHISRDIYESIPPEIVSASASPDTVVPGDEREVYFQVEVSDEDGGDNVARVIVDASKVGMGILALQTLPELKEDRECVRTDYVIGDWGTCRNNVQRRSVELRADVLCDEDDSSIPVSERTCADSVCLRSDWEPGTWGPCVDGVQSREYIKRADSTCVGESEKPTPERQNCSTASPTAFWNSVKRILLPAARAVTIYGSDIWVQSSPTKVPDWVPEGRYELPVTVIDQEGSIVKGSIPFTVARDSVGTPRIDEDDIHVSPRYSISNDGKTEFQVFVKVTDPNGHQDIASVSLNLSEIGLPPVQMQKGQIEGAGAWYASPKLTIPRSVIPGFRELTVAATDKSGNSVSEEFRFHVATPDNSGDEPTIPVDRAYTNPRAFVNDQKTTGALYVFVEEGDAPIAHVSANLGTILRYFPPEVTVYPNGNGGFDASPVPDENGNTPSPTTTRFAPVPSPSLAPPPPPPITWIPHNLIPQAIAQGTPPSAVPPPATGGGFGSGVSPTATPDDGLEYTVPGENDQNGISPYFELPQGDGLPIVGDCVSTDTIICMVPTVNEGSRGKWYYLPNLIVRKGVLPSQNPYFISVVATDEEGRKAEAEVPVFVSDGVIPTTDFDLPYLVSAVATDRHEVQAFFSSSLDLSRIRSDAFHISFFNDVHTRLPIKNIDVRSDGRVVIFRTNPMNVDDRYTLFADAEQLGLKQGQQTSNQADFMGYNINVSGKFFQLEAVTPKNANTLEVVFRKNLRFSSLLVDGSNFSIVEKGTGNELPVRRAQIGSSADTVVVSTDTQRAGVTYLLRVENLTDFSGQKLKPGFGVMLFDAFVNYEEIRKLLNLADFNQDGKVDFLDFSIFSTVYGTSGTEEPEAQNMDLNEDGRVDFLDFTIFAQQYGQQVEVSPSPSPSPTGRTPFSR